MRVEAKAVLVLGALALAFSTAFASDPPRGPAPHFQSSTHDQPSASPETKHPLTTKASAPAAPSKASTLTDSALVNPEWERHIPSEYKIVPQESKSVLCWAAACANIMEQRGLPVPEQRLIAAQGLVANMSGNRISAGAARNVFASHGIYTEFYPGATSEEELQRYLNLDVKIMALATVNNVSQSVLIEKYLPDGTYIVFFPDGKLKAMSYDELQKKIPCQAFLAIFPPERAAAPALNFSGNPIQAQRTLQSMGLQVIYVPQPRDQDILNALGESHKILAQVKLHGANHAVVLQALGPIMESNHKKIQTVILSDPANGSTSLFSLDTLRSKYQLKDILVVK